GIVNVQRAHDCSPIAIVSPGNTQFSARILLAAALTYPVACLHRATKNHADAGGEVPPSGRIVVIRFDRDRSAWVIVFLAAAAMGGAACSGSKDDTGGSGLSS